MRAQYDTVHGWPALRPRLQGYAGTQGCACSRRKRASCAIQSAGSGPWAGAHNNKAKGSQSLLGSTLGQGGYGTRPDTNRTHLLRMHHPPPSDTALTPMRVANVSMPLALSPSTSGRSLVTAMTTANRVTKVVMKLRVCACGGQGGMGEGAAGLLRGVKSCAVMPTRAPPPPHIHWLGHPIC